MTVYLDTSSLVKLYVAEPGSDRVRRLIGRASMVATSLVAYPEARAALARLRRERGLDARGFARAKRDLDADWPKFVGVELTTSLCREAGDLAERYRLRGYDAVHLASFAELARRTGVRNTRFSSFDDRLNRSARSLRRTVGR